jgi:3-keto-5-aminohexanoate cleavage enzyme
MKKIIITVAPVAASTPEKVDNPLTPEAIARDVVAAAKAGASIVHLHVRDRQGNLTEDLSIFSKTLSLIRDESDIIIQGSTGGVSRLSLEERCTALEDSRVEMASLNMGSVNFDEGVFINTLPEIRYWARRMKEKGVHPEMEVFEGGMINNAQMLIGEGQIPAGSSYAFTFGMVGAVPATVRDLYHLQDLLPPGALWNFIHHGHQDFSLFAAALGMGASGARVGFEDSIYYAPGRFVKTNAELVQKLAALVRDIGYEVATPDEARQILGIHRTF